MTKQTVFDPDIEANRITAALSYLWILFLIPLLLKRNSKFCQFHAKQGLVLFIIGFIASFLFWVPFFGQVLWLVIIILVVVGVIKAYNGEFWKMPFIYQWSEKIKI